MVTSSTEENKIMKILTNEFRKGEPEITKLKDENLKKITKIQGILVTVRDF